MKKEIICGIYIVFSPSGKIYIGQSINIYKRWHIYKLGHCKGQIKLIHSFKKHGYENHRFEILEACQEYQLDEREIYYIKLYDTFESEHGLNLQKGGEGGRLSEESLKKLSKSLKARNAIFPRVLSETTKESIRKGMMGHIPPNKGKHHTMEAREKISKSLMGNTYNLGRKQPQEVIDKRNATRKQNNKPSPLLGIKLSPDRAKKLEEIRKVMWEKRKNNPEWNSAENIKKRSELARLAATKQKYEDPNYYSEENKKKRSDKQKMAAQTRKQNIEKRIEQERLTMIF